MDESPSRKKMEKLTSPGVKWRRGFTVFEKYSPSRKGSTVPWTKTELLRCFIRNKFLIRNGPLFRRLFEVCTNCSGGKSPAGKSDPALSAQCVEPPVPEPMKGINLRELERDLLQALSEHTGRPLSISRCFGWGAAGWEKKFSNYTDDL